MQLGTQMSRLYFEIKSQCQGHSEIFWRSHTVRWFAIEHHLQGEHKKVAPPKTFVDSSAMPEDFCMKFYTTVKQSNIHFITKFG